MGKQDRAMSFAHSQYLKGRGDDHRYNANELGSAF